MYVYYLENFFFFTTKHFPFSRRDADDMAARAPFSSASGQIAEVSLSLSCYFFFLVFLSFLIFMYQDQHLVWTAAAGVCPTLVVFAS
jgi:hypothetical protein